MAKSKQEFYTDDELKKMNPLGKLGIAALKLVGVLVKVKKPNK